MSVPTFVYHPTFFLFRGINYYIPTNWSAHAPPPVALHTSTHFTQSPHFVPCCFLLTVHALTGDLALPYAAPQIKGLLIYSL